MGNLFGKNVQQKMARKAQAKKGPEIDEKDRAMLDLKLVRDKLKKFNTQLESDSVKLDSQIRQLLSSNHRDRAMTTLKLKKIKEKKISETNSQLMKVEEMVDSIRTAAWNAEMFKTLQAGTKVLQDLTASTSIEKVQRLMEDNADAVQASDEIVQAMNEAMTSSSSSVTDMASFETEIEAALAAYRLSEGIEAEAEAEAINPVPSVTHPPTVNAAEAAKEAALASIPLPPQHVPQAPVPAPQKEQKKTERVLVTA